MKGIIYKKNKQKPIELTITLHCYIVMLIRIRATFLDNKRSINMKTFVERTILHKLFVLCQYCWKYCHFNIIWEKVFIKWQYCMPALEIKLFKTRKIFSVNVFKLMYKKSTNILKYTLFTKVAWKNYRNEVRFTNL